MCVRISVTGLRFPPLPRAPPGCSFALVRHSFAPPLPSPSPPPPPPQAPPAAYGPRDQPEAGPEIGRPLICSPPSSSASRPPSEPAGASVAPARATPPRAASSKVAPRPATERTTITGDNCQSPAHHSAPSLIARPATEHSSRPLIGEASGPDSSPSAAEEKPRAPAEASLGRAPLAAPATASVSSSCSPAA